MSGELNWIRGKRDSKIHQVGSMDSTSTSLSSISLDRDLATNTSTTELSPSLDLSTRLRFAARGGLLFLLASRLEIGFVWEVLVWSEEIWPKVGHKGGKSFSFTCTETSILAFFFSRHCPNRTRLVRAIDDGDLEV